MRAPLAAFAHRLASLRFTSPTLSRVIASEVRQAELSLAARPSDLCADIAAAAAGGFASIPAATELHDGARCAASSVPDRTADRARGSSTLGTWPTPRPPSRPRSASLPSATS